jgi:succinoglycan biosynthesis transport protein ExoP
MKTHLLLAAIRARYRLFLFICGTTVMVATIVSLLLPKTYVAEVSMLVDNKADQSMSNSIDAPVRERIGYMQTQVDIISSPKVAQKVVRDLKLESHPEAFAAVGEDFAGANWLADRMSTTLLNRLKVSTSQSSVINIAFPSLDPKFSAQIANAFAKAYRDTALELRVEPSKKTAAWFDEQITNLRNNLDQALARLANYQKDKGIVTLDEQQLDADNFVTSQHKEGSPYSSPVLRQQMLARSMLANERGNLNGNFTSAQNQRIRAELQQSETKLRELGAQLGSNHPSYQRQLSTTMNLRAELSRSSEQASQSSPRTEAAFRNAMTAQQARLAEIRDYRNQSNVLIREVDIAQKAYETAMQRAVEKKVESRASLSNVSILNAATVPFIPARPRVLLNIALSVIVGTLLGLSTIYLMEMFDRRIRNLGDLENEWNVPLLAELNNWQADRARLINGPDPIKFLPNHA